VVGDFRIAENGWLTVEKFEFAANFLETFKEVGSGLRLPNIVISCHEMNQFRYPVYSNTACARDSFDKGEPRQWPCNVELTDEFL